MADRNKKVCKTIGKILLLTGMVFSLSTESILASASALPMANEEEVLADGQSDVQDALSVEDEDGTSVENAMEASEEVPDEIDEAGNDASRENSAENGPDEPIGEQEESGDVNSPEESAAVEEGMEWEDAPLEFYEVQEDGLYQFLCRLYEKILQRPGDQEGIAYWYELLRSGKMSGAEIVMKFGNSAEMEAQKLDNPQFIERLYRTCFDREPDKEGAAYWTGLLDKGVSRNYALKGFAMSEEFRQICQSFGIQQGTVTLKEARDKNTGITMFVYRCYQECLNRTPDEAGMNYWCELLLNGKKKPVDVARDFMSSPEMTARNLNDTEFVKILYQAYFGRAYDESGLQYWTGLLAAGKNRQSLITSFSRSREFAVIVTSFGLPCDDYTGDRVLIRQNVRDDGTTSVSYDTLQKNGSYTFYQVRAADMNGGFCYAIVSPHGKLIMIDGGYKGDAVQVKDFILAHGGVVDQWYITHPHFDHVGALLEILDKYQEEISVKEVYYSPFTEEFCQWAIANPNQIESKEVLMYEAFTQTQKKQTKIKFQALKRDDQITVDGISILCMNSFDSSMRDVNSNSLVLRINISGVVFLVTGDITDSSVQKMKNYYGENNVLWNVDVIQAPHHGYLAGISNTALYQLTQPTYAWMDCSQYEYEHDSVNVVKHKKWIEDMGIQVLMRYQGTNEIHVN